MVPLCLEPDAATDDQPIPATRPDPAPASPPAQALVPLTDSSTTPDGTDAVVLPDDSGFQHSTPPHVESTYLRMLQAGEGTHDSREGSSLLPKGIQVAVVKGVEGESASMAWELNNVSAVFALLAGTTAAEGLELTMVDEAKTRLDWPKWDDAINAELKSLADAHTWDVVEWPLNTNIVSCEWVFKIKKNSAGEINKYKAWLVACSFTQQYGVDYDEIYTPVACLASLCLILAIMAHHNWDVNVFDFHSAFLNGKLDDNEVIFMELPSGFDTQGHDLVA